jgi:hypothetical protein
MAKTRDGLRLIGPKHLFSGGPVRERVDYAVLWRMAVMKGRDSMVKTGL